LVYAAPHFVDHTQADADGTFNGYFARPKLWLWAKWDWTNPSEPYWWNSFPGSNFCMRTGPDGWGGMTDPYYDEMNLRLDPYMATNDFPRWDAEKFLLRTGLGVLQEVTNGFYSTNVPGWQVGLGEVYEVAQLATSVTRSVSVRLDEVPLQSWGVVTNGAMIRAVGEAMAQLKWVCRRGRFEVRQWRYEDPAGEQRYATPDVGWEYHRTNEPEVVWGGPYSAEYPEWRQYVGMYHIEGTGTVSHRYGTGVDYG